MSKQRQTSINSFFRSSARSLKENQSPDNELNNSNPSNITQSDGNLKRSSGGTLPNENLSKRHKTHNTPTPINSSTSSNPPTSSNSSNLPSYKTKLNEFQFQKSKGNGKDKPPLIQKQKEIHSQFLNKLGKPGSLSQIRSRYRRNLSDDIDQEEDDEEHNTEKKPKSRQKLTPLDEQYIALKKEYPDAIILVEVGYRYKIYGYDAAIASKEIGWVLAPGKLSIDNSHPDDHLYNTFASCSFPVHNLDRHVQKLVKRGHKVGIVNQMETAAIKSAGDNKNKIFKRELTCLLTQGTMFEDFQYESQGQFNTKSITSSYILSLCIDKSSASNLKFGILAVSPSTGDVIIDEFSDTPLLTEFETRLLHIQPCEIILIGDIPTNVTNMIKNLSTRGSSNDLDSLKIRVEYEPIPTESDASISINNFYSANEKVIPPTNLTSLTSICLHSTIEYLKKFKLENVLYLTKNFTNFQNRNHMLLNGNTLTSLEIFQNETTYTTIGSLFWVIDQTFTRFGQRLLKSWVANPLTDREKLEYRVQAVSEIINSRAKITEVAKIADIMRNLPDLEKGLIRLYYKRCTRKQLYSILDHLQRISTAFTETNPEKFGFKSTILNELFSTLPKCTKQITEALLHINSKAAKADNKEDFFNESEFDEYENIADQKLLIQEVEQSLKQHLVDLRKQFKNQNLNYVTVKDTTHLLEFKLSDARNVPDDWFLINSTKTVKRYHSSETKKLLKALDYHREKLIVECDDAFSNFMNKLIEDYELYREVINAVSQLDCIMSLAAVSCRSGFVCAKYVDSPGIHVVQGRHPMIDPLLSTGSFVPNDINMSHDSNRTLIVTGPNMGGKSSYVRQVALICIMAQVGCYVPAESATIGIVDAIFTRMGAYDNMLAGESTFMVELKECADIINNATERSVVILDEIGRGTSTMDGVGIAHAVLSYFITNIKSLTLFITHYPLLASIEKDYPDIVANYHMGFLEQDGELGKEITFLYTLEKGIAHRSYGLNVARLAGIPSTVLELAREKSDEIEKKMIIRRKERQLIKDIELIKAVIEGDVIDERLYKWIL